MGTHGCNSYPCPICHASAIQAAHQQISNQTQSDRRIWPWGRYEVYDLADERLNGFHTREDAEFAAATIEGSIVIDRAERFSW